LEPAGATSVFLFALLTAVATGLGAVPFAFAKHPTRRWLGASNAIAAGLMLAASLTSCPGSSTRTWMPRS
jgi:zinc transporter ZupT